MEPSILDTVRFDSDAGDNLSLREYLHCLLEKLWDDGEGFSGKRPFGNSGWQSEVYAALIRTGHLPGKMDDDDCYIEQVNEHIASLMVRACIREAILGPKEEPRP